MQDSFRVPRVFQSTGWGMRKITVKELASAMDIPQVNASEAFSLALV